MFKNSDKEQGFLRKFSGLFKTFTNSSEISEDIRVTQKQDITLTEFAEAMKVLSVHAHIKVNINQEEEDLRESDCDSTVSIGALLEIPTLSGHLMDISYNLLPRVVLIDTSILSKENNLEWAEKHSLREVSEDAVKELKERYSDFPGVEDALDTISQVHKNVEKWRVYLRNTAQPEQIEELVHYLSDACFGRDDETHNHSSYKSNNEPDAFDKIDMQTKKSSPAALELERTINPSTDPFDQIDESTKNRDLSLDRGLEL